MVLPVPRPEHLDITVLFRIAPPQQIPKLLGICRGAKLASNDIRPQSEGELRKKTIGKINAKRHTGRLSTGASPNPSDLCNFIRRGRIEGGEASEQLLWQFSVTGSGKKEPRRREVRDEGLDRGDDPIWVRRREGDVCPPGVMVASKEIAAGVAEPLVMVLLVEVVDVLPFGTKPALANLARLHRKLLFDADVDQRKNARTRWINVTLRRYGIFLYDERALEKRPVYPLSGNIIAAFAHLACLEEWCAERAAEGAGPNVLKRHPMVVTSPCAVDARHSRSLTVAGTFGACPIRRGSMP